MGRSGAALDWLAVAAVASAFWPLAGARRALSGTTLVGAHRWALIALAGWLIVAAGDALRAAPGNTGHLRYTAAALSVCPMVAVLGARRPGLGAWHFVVLVLLVVLLVPLLQTLLRDRWARPLRCEDAWTLLFTGVLLVGTVNYVPTRLGPPVCLVALFLAAVALSVGPWQAARDTWIARWGARLAPAAMAAGTWLAWWTCLRRQVATPPRSWNRVWRDYRERFGLIWSRRIQERFNASAVQLDWPVRLGWGGFAPHPEQPSGTQAALSLLDRPGPAQTALRSLLRRFVADEWIAQRLERPTGLNTHE